mgnify:FL=1
MLLIARQTQNDILSFFRLVRWIVIHTVYVSRRITAHTAFQIMAQETSRGTR